MTTRPTWSTFAALAALLATMLTLAGCGAGSTSSPTSSSPPPATIPVLATTNVYGSIVTAVGGDRVQVTSIINDPSADPHAYESKPEDAVKAKAAKLVVANGGGYDDFLPKLVAAAGTNPKVIDVVTLSGLDPATGAGAEHVWYSLATVKKLAAQLVTELSAIDPPGASGYAANLSTFNGKIDGLQSKLDAIKAAHPGARAAITEPVPGYLLEAAGIKDETPAEFVEAVEQETDPSAAALNKMLTLLKAPNPVRVLVLNSQTEIPVIKQVEQAATAANVPVVRMSETLPAGITDYVTWMDQQIDALAAALNRR